MQPNIVKYHVIFNLDNNHDAFAVPDYRELVHQKELSRIIDHIDRSLASAEHYKVERESNNKPIQELRCHDAITISGGRGTGKTTLMLSLASFVRDGKSGETAPSVKPWQKFSRKIEVLDLLDPTLIEEKDHLFVNIISRIKEVVDEKVSRLSLRPKGKPTEIQDKFNAVLRSFKMMAAGLPALEGVGTNRFMQDEWHDSEFVMEQGELQVRAANKLEENFHDFVRHSLDFLSRESFLLCFDDIDTDFKKGWPVLETIRKYLTTPQIILMISGDLELYSNLLKQKILGDFGHQILQFERCNNGYSDKLKNTVTHLEEQYFLKILKSERRVFLETMEKKTRNPDYLIEVWFSDTNGDIHKEEIRKFYKRLLKEHGVRSDAQLQFYLDFLTTQPIRIQKQLMHEYVTEPKELPNKLTAIFHSSLSRMDIDVGDVRNYPDSNLIRFLEYLEEKKLINEGYSFRPYFQDNVVNGAQFSGGLILSQRFQENPAEIFEYILRIGLSRELDSLMGHEQTERSGSGMIYGSPSLRNFLEQCSVLRTRNGVHVARMATAYMRGYRGWSLGIQKNRSGHPYISENPWLGTLPLYGLYSKAKEKVRSRLRIDYLINNLPLLEGILVKLPLSAATDHRSVTIPVYSIFNLFGVISELLHGLSKLKSKGEFVKGDQIETVSSILIKNSQLRFCPMPGWALDRLESSYEHDKDWEESEIAESDIKILAEDIVKWFDHYDQNFIQTQIQIPPYLLARMVTRFFYILSQIDNSYPEVEEQLGMWFSKMVVAFLHSVLIEVAIESTEIPSNDINLYNNPIKDSKFFELNLKKIPLKKPSDDRITFEYLAIWILDCPLFKPYLNPELVNQITEVLKVDSPSVSVWSHLEKVAIRENITGSAYKKFRIDNTECIADVKRILERANVTPEECKELSSTKFEKLIFKELKAIYPKINSGTPKAIHKRIKNGKLAW